MALSALVSQILSVIAPLLQLYLAWSLEEPRSLSEREARLKEFSEKLCERLLEADAKVDEAKVRPEGCDCGGRFRSKGLRKRTLLTSVGEVTYRRRYYECESCHAHRLPVDEAWGVESGCLSPKAKTLGSELATALPYREAREWLSRLGRIDLSVSTLWRTTQQAGEALVCAERERLKESESRSGAATFLAAMRAPGTARRPVIGADGLFLRIGREWKEVKLAVFGELTETGEWVKGRTSYRASLEGADQFRQALVRHALDRGITRASEVAIVSDGAEWIAALPRRFYPRARHILDYWHAKQYLWKAAHLVFGEGSPQAAAFVEALKGDLWKGRISAILERVETERRVKKPQNTQTAEELRKAMNYLSDRREALQYEAFRERGDPTGSGPVEGGCKSVVQSRMKRSGMNWSPQGAERMLHLRARYCEHLIALN